MHSELYNPDSIKAGFDLNEVLITISNKKTNDTYLSRSYPDSDFNNNGKMELYRTPVYKVYIENTHSRIEWKALRFMPYWNDPKYPNKSYSTRGWVNAGLSSAITRKVVTHYNPYYSTSNRYSHYRGAIQIRDSFLIHAGPETVKTYGWAAAGCVEIIGDFNQFKEDIKKLSNSSKQTSDEALKELVNSQKLLVSIEAATPPNFKKHLYKEVKVKNGH